MPLIAVAGAKNAGGATFVPVGRKVRIQGRGVCLVGDRSVTPCKLHKKPMFTVILAGASKTRENGRPFAMLGSATSCGHPVIFTPQAIVRSL